MLLCILLCFNIETDEPNIEWRFKLLVDNFTAHNEILPRQEVYHGNDNDHDNDYFLYNL
jgi:hypothetical protein